MVYQDDESLIDLVGFDNDRAFLEPSLFYFLRKKTFNEQARLNITQILRGYGNENISILDVYSDANGVCYLPNLGYSIFNDNDKLHKNIRLDALNRTLENGKITPIKNLSPVQKGIFYACYHKPELFEDNNIELRGCVISQKYNN